MKKIILLAAIGMLASNAMAMSRHEFPVPYLFVCHEKVAREGSVVLRYPSHHIRT